MGSNVGQKLVVVRKTKKLGERAARPYFPQREKDMMMMMMMMTYICKRMDIFCNKAMVTTSILASYSK